MGRREWQFPCAAKAEAEPGQQELSNQGLSVHRGGGESLGPMKLFQMHTEFLHWFQVALETSKAKYNLTLFKREKNLNLELQNKISLEHEMNIFVYNKCLFCVNAYREVQRTGSEQAQRERERVCVRAQPLLMHTVFSPVQQLYNHVLHVCLKTFAQGQHL